MNEITMIPIEKLRHHPENPRLDLGDLTELAASIKANGIMQNLTVVRPTFFTEGDEDIWWVVIGNRRMEAAMMVGLKEVPATIRDIDYNTQIATMLQENMQRSDLTVYEQAKGIQMMMNLGFTKDQISEKTGFSKTTIERRLAVASLPEDKAKEAVSLGYDLMDLVEISKIENTETQKELLSAASNMNEGLDQRWLRQRIASAQREEERKREKARLLPEIQKFAKPMKDGENVYSSSWEHLRSLDLKLEPGATVKAPKDPGNYYYRESWGTIEIYQKVKKEKHVKTDAEIALEKKQHDAKELNERMRENRIAFCASFTPNKTQETKLKALMFDYIFGWKSVYSEGDFFTSYHSWSIALFRKLCGMPKEEERPKDESLLEEIKRRNIPMGRAILAWMLCGGLKPDDREGYASNYNGDYRSDKDMDDVYTVLTDAGYVLTEEEQQWKDGTHPFFERASQ